MPIATLNSEPTAFSNSTAGPPLLTKRSAIAVISSTGSTDVEILRNSPAASSARTKSKVPSNGMATLHLFSQSAVSVPAGHAIMIEVDFPIPAFEALQIV